MLELVTQSWRIGITVGSLGCIDHGGALVIGLLWGSIIQINQLFTTIIKLRNVIVNLVTYDPSYAFVILEGGGGGKVIN